MHGTVTRGGEPGGHPRQKTDFFQQDNKLLAFAGRWFCWNNVISCVTLRGSPWNDTTPGHTYGWRTQRDFSSPVGHSRIRLKTKNGEGSQCESLAYTKYVYRFVCADRWGRKRCGKHLALPIFSRNDRSEADASVPVTVQIYAFFGGDGHVTWMRAYTYAALCSVGTTVPRGLFRSAPRLGSIVFRSPLRNLFISNPRECEEFSWDALLHTSLCSRIKANLRTANYSSPHVGLVRTVRTSTVEKNDTTDELQKIKKN